MASPTEKAAAAATRARNAAAKLKAMKAETAKKLRELRADLKSRQVGATAAATATTVGAVGGAGSALAIDMIRERAEPGTIFADKTAAVVGAGAGLALVAAGAAMKGGAPPMLTALALGVVGQATGDVARELRDRASSPLGSTRMGYQGGGALPTIRQAQAWLGQGPSRGALGYLERSGARLGYLEQGGARLGYLEDVTPSRRSSAAAELVPGLEL